MNNLLNHGFGRAAVTAMIFVSGWLGFMAFKIGGHYIYTYPFHIENLSLGLSGLLSFLLAAYYVVKVVWGSKYLNFDPDSPKWKLIALSIMFTSAVASIGLFQTMSRLELSETDPKATALGMLFMYMVITAIVTLAFVSDVADSEKK